MMSHKTDTREKILITASRLFKVHGYYATGLNDILKESGAPKGSFYYHFPDGKDELALEAIRRMSQNIQQQIENVLMEVADPALAFQNFVRQLATKVLQEDELYYSISILALETCFTHEPLRLACAEAFQSWQKIFEKKLIQSGLAQESACELSIIIQSMIEGANILAVTTKDSTPLLRIADAMPTIIQARL